MELSAKKKKNPFHIMKRKGERGVEMGVEVKSVVFIIVVSEADTDFPENCPSDPRTSILSPALSLSRVQNMAERQCVSLTLYSHVV